MFSMKSFFAHSIGGLFSTNSSHSTKLWQGETAPSSTKSDSDITSSREGPVTSFICDNEKARLTAEVENEKIHACEQINYDGEMDSKILLSHGFALAFKEDTKLSRALLQVVRIDYPRLKRLTYVRMYLHDGEYSILCHGFGHDNNKRKVQKYDIIRLLDYRAAMAADHDATCESYSIVKSNIHKRIGKVSKRLIDKPFAEYISKKVFKVLASKERKDLTFSVPGSPVYGEGTQGSAVDLCLKFDSFAKEILKVSQYVFYTYF